MRKDASIIFDMDGTLIDSSAAMTHSVNYVRQNLGLEPIGQKYLEYHINQPDQHLPKIFYNTEEYDPAHRALFKEHYMHFSPSMISLYPDVKEMLQVLSQKAYLAIATNASDFFARHMLEQMGIIEYFSAIVGANNVAEPKPSPLMVYRLMEELGSVPEKTILVGDSIKDERAAANAGINFVFALWGYGTSETAELRAHNIHELVGLLNTII
ncbi:HAD family hydrolase [Sulfurospirillum oryzae]|uniref:HAD family hydrolase n=1 Tax=Sulfurospirillum oryzae TaxID=2976535 RepID=UPI0021E8D864|nr:HAD family hydrolase [Sulfurospirillum oryzae]